MQIVPLPVYSLLFRKTLDVNQIYTADFPESCLEGWSPDSFCRTVIWVYPFAFMKYTTANLSGVWVMPQSVPGVHS